MRVVGGLPPLPEYWEWGVDEDGDWFACHGPTGATVYTASNPAYETVRGTGCDVPVRVAVAVAQANSMPWEPSDKPVGGPWCARRLPKPEQGYRWVQVRVRAVDGGADR